MPVVETAPPVVARPNACVSRSNSPHVRPGCARTVRVFGSTRIPFRAERSITRPPSHRALPGDIVAAAPYRQLETLGEADAERGL